MPVAPCLLSRWLIWQPRLEEAVVARITRKRTEWSHEKECGSLPARSDRSTISMTPFAACSSARASSPKHAMQVCDVLDRRPVEVLHGLQHKGLSSRSGASSPLGRSMSASVSALAALIQRKILARRRSSGTSLAYPSMRSSRSAAELHCAPTWRTSPLSTSQAVPRAQCTSAQHTSCGAAERFITSAILTNTCTHCPVRRFEDALKVEK